MTKKIEKVKSTRAARPKAVPVKTVASTNPPVKHFPVVGFGASAGGLEAFSNVLKHLDPNLGMAYVLVMHLSPTFKSSLAEILQTKTKMKVHTVKDGMEVKPNNVYVIPPNAFMSLVDGHLKLGPRALSTIGNFAVDYFLTALASIYKNNSIGIILSGTATDGTFGLKAIKAEGGITFAQDDTAKFPGMPKNAYDSGYADFILSPENIARELAELIRIPYTALASDKIAKKHEQERSNDAEALKQILLKVKVKTGIDFFLHYKQASIYRRIVRRTVLNKCRSLEDYYAILEVNEKEVHDLYNDFLINVTNFFRDPDFYTTLDNKVFPSIVERKATDPIRIWVAGCATGEEAYSIAICLTEYLEKEELNTSFQIFASDLDARAIEKARVGVYPVSSLQNVSQHHLKRFFKQIDGHYQIEKSIREVCIFSQQNLLKDPPFSRVDLISCQNVMIYLEADPQQRLLQTFHYALKPGGYLFLGKSESIGGAIDLFEPLDKKVRVFTRKAATSPPLEFSTRTTGLASIKDPKRAFLPSKPDIEKEMSKILLTRFVIPSVVLNPNLNIIQFFGVTAPYLSPVVGKASLNVLKMIREELLIDLRALLQQARKTEKIVFKEGITISDKKTEQEITIEVIPKRNESELFYLVVFKEHLSRHPQEIKSKRSGKRADQREMTIIKLEDELMQARELLRTTNEEYETTYEELQSYNEETLSSNEELQSVNEQLETSKEELQSTNEELTTINDELQKRNIELKESQNYAKAIVDTVNSPFLILTSNLQVRSANRSFYKTFKLAPEKTEGSFIYELGDRTWDIPVLRENLNDLLGKKTSYLEFHLKHNFPGIGELVFIVSAYRMLKEDSKETLILLAFINISDILKANQDLKRLNEHLEQFAFVTSHDLQEPLRKIQTFSNYLIGRENLDSYTIKYIDKINATAVRMSTLLKDLLSYSLLMKNREKEFVRVDLNKTVTNVCKDLELFIEDKHAILNIDALPEILGEPVQINQLFYNLISNALKFNNTIPVIEIFVQKPSLEDFDKHGLTEGRPYVWICVKDNGIGFDQKYADKIFTIFQRLDDKPDVKGSGMGLAICKKIVEDHGGSIFARSKENEGATFWILLPAA